MKRIKWIYLFYIHDHGIMGWLLVYDDYFMSAKLDHTKEETETILEYHLHFALQNFLLQSLSVKKVLKYFAPTLVIFFKFGSSGRKRELVLSGHPLLSGQ